MGTEPLLECEVFRPWDDSQERRLRARILRCQRMATQRIKSANSDHARTLYWVALDLAAGSAFATSGKEFLQDALNAMTRLFVVAGQFERWEGQNGE